jgi:hypothetical protein
MPLYPCKYLLTSGIALALVAISSAVGAQTLLQDVADARQETQVWKAYALDQHLSADNLEVSVLNGKVTLSGEVETAANKTLAKAIALRVNGIVAVDNQIVVQTQQTEVDSQAGDGTEQPDRGSWISAPGQSTLSHTDDTGAPLSPLDRGAASMLSAKPSNQAKFASALEQPQRLPALEGLYPDAFRF